VNILGVEVQPILLTTSLYRLRKYGACSARYAHLRNKLGSEYWDKTPINLLTILTHNGVEDALWALCAVEQDCEQIARLMAADFAESVLHLYEARHPNDNRPRLAIAATRAFAVGKTGEAARAAAGEAAGAAAWEAAGAAAWAAAREAAGAAAGAAAWEAAREAAWAAAREAAGAAAREAAGAAQAAIIRRYLLPDSTPASENIAITLEDLQERVA
jgi:hypothetical protein